MKKIKKQILHFYFRIRTWWPMWFYVLNAPARRAFQMHPVALNPVQTKIFNDLARDGISVTSLKELFPEEDLLPTFQAYLKELESRATSRTKKAFLQQFWEIVPALDFKNPFVPFALNKRVRDIVNSYMEMWTHFKAFTLIRTVPVGAADPVQSQRWHRDPEEKRMCKVFVYLVDVDEETGPFTYIPESVYGKKWGSYFPQKAPEGSYPPVGEIEKLIPQEEYRVMTGKAGTVLFCDTSGFHRGGHATKKERLMFTAHYAAPTFSEGCRYEVPASLLSGIQDDPSLVFALSSKKLELGKAMMMQ